MNKRLKKALQTAFDAPRPVDKERFLKSLPYARITYPLFFLSQFRYIRKRLWVLSIMIAFMGWAAAFGQPALIDWQAESGKIWMISSVLPFWAMLTATELFRSSFYRMAELEAVCQFSLPQLMMARITILGGVNFLILALLLVFVSQASPYSLLQVILYLMVPYLVTSGLCLFLMNRMQGQESVYNCAAAACLVSAANMISGSSMQLLYTHAYLACWLLLFASSALLVSVQLRNLLSKGGITYGTYS
jgi:hypothetical protein